MSVVTTLRSSGSRSVRAFVLVLAGVASTGLTHAQTAAPAAGGGSQCTKPDAHPGRLASDRQLRSWDKEVTTWQECMKTYVAEKQAKADEAVKVANAAVAQSNAAVAEYNDVVKELQAQVDAAKK